MGVLNFSELGKIRNVAILVFLLSTASLVCWRGGVAGRYRGTWGIMGDSKRTRRRAEKTSKQHDQRESLKCPTDSSTSLLSYCFPPPHILLEWLPWKQAIAFSVIVTRQQSNIYPFEVIQKQPMRVCLTIHCWLETETWDFVLRNLDAKPQHSSTSSWSPDNKWHQDLFPDWALYFVFRLPSGLLLSYRIQKNTDSL